ncbi:MAG: hypothetical protein ACPGN3_05090 [Opitutales bacterium]
MPLPHENEMLAKLRESSGTRNAHLSIEKRTALFNTLDERKNRLSGWIWKLSGLVALSAACWIVFLSQPTPETPQAKPAQEIAQSPPVPATQPAPSLFSVWKEDDPVDRSIQNLQKRLDNTERPALFSRGISDSRENDLRRRLKRLKDDLS